MAPDTNDNVHTSGAGGGPDMEAGRHVSPDGIRRAPAAWLPALFIAGALFVWWTVARADHDMRNSLVQQAQLVAQAMDFKHVQALAGTAADLGSPDYLRLKEQFVAIRSADPQCRFVYLMGRRADGTVFFFVDSEPAGSKDYSPPGQAYEEATANDHRMFDTGEVSVAGPDPDRWGIWVSALVPITDPDSGKVAAVLGMDVDARAWKWDVAARASPAAGLMLVLLIGLAAAFAATRRVGASPRPVLRRLLPSLSAMVVLLFVGAGLLLWRQHRQQMAGEITIDMAHVADELHAVLEQQSAGLAATLLPITADAAVRQSLREGASDRLLAAWRPVFDVLHRENQLTHFCFFDTNRVCLLRVENPGNRGDRIDRFAAREAERTGRTASGINLGPMGTFTLRVVKPVFESGRLVGYVELGKEIEDVLRALKPRPGVQLAVVVRKDFLSRRSWEPGMRLLGRDADWDRLPGSVMIYASQGRLPDAFAQWADQLAGAHVHGETDREIVSGGKAWRVAAAPLPDASGREVGDLLILRDITAEKAAFARLLILCGTAGGVLLALLLGFIYALLRRTDAGIAAQQVALRANEEKYRRLFSEMSIGCALHQIICDGSGRPVDYVTLEVNDAFARLMKVKRADVVGRRAGEILPPAELAKWLGIFGPVALTGKSVYFENYSDRNQRYFEGTAYCPEPGKFAGTFIDVTERVRAQALLQERESELLAILESTADGILAVDDKGKVVKANRKFAELWRIPPALMAGGDDRALLDFVLAQLSDPGAFMEKVQLLYKSDAVDMDTLAFKDGRVFERASTPMVMDGRVTGRVWLFRDITGRRQAEAALIASEVRYRRLFESAKDGILILDAGTGMVVDVNPFLVQLLGFSREAFLGKAVWELGFFRDIVANEANFAELQRKEYIRYEDKPLETADGRRIEVEFVSNVYLVDRRKVIQCNIRDITEHRKAVEKLRDSEALFSATFHSSPIPCSITDPGSEKWVEVNQAFLDVTGYTRAEVIGHTFRELNLWKRPADREKMKALLAAQGRVRNFEADINAKGGATGAMLISVDNVYLAGKPYLMIMGIEMTERKRAEVERERLAAAVGQAAEAVVITDADATILYANPAFTKITGYAPEEAVGRNPRILKSGRHDAEFYRQMWAALTAGNVWTGRFTNKRKDGTLYEEEASISPVRDAAGKIVNYVAVKRDVTREAELEDQLRQAHKMESVGRLAGGVAHDFNNMLGVIIGHAELALAQVDPVRPLHDDLVEIRTAAERSADLTRQLLAFARRQAIAPKVLDLNETVAGLLNMLRRLIGENIQLGWQPGADLWPVKMDTSQLDQILTNLCVNARDAIAGVGKVFIETGNHTFGGEYCADHAGFVPGDYVRLTVGDTGVGMDKETLSHLFEPFFTTKDLGKGTGLGLATVYGAVKQNNGFIYADSEPGRGATFNIYLPRHAGGAAELPQAAPAQPDARGTGTILLVEDEPSILKMAAIMLEKQGYTVLAASTPREAIRLAREHAGKIHLLMTDVIMPEMNGLDLAETLLALCPHIKRLFMSGYTADVIARHGVMDEGVYFIQKPFDIKSLAAKVHEALEGT